jgi:hypothetical protein
LPSGGFFDKKNGLIDVGLIGEVIVVEPLFGGIDLRHKLLFLFKDKVNFNFKVNFKVNCIRCAHWAAAQTASIT